MKRISYILIGVTLLCLAVVFYGEFAQLRPLSGGLPSPDMRMLGYTHEAFIDWQTAMGEAGAALYLKYFGGVFGAVLPLLIGASLISVMIMALNRFPRFARRSAAVKILVPLIFILPFVFFDIFENAVLYDMVSGPGTWGKGMTQFASILTNLKFTFLAIALLALAAFWLAGLKHTKSEKQ